MPDKMIEVRRLSWEGEIEEEIEFLERAGEGRSTAKIFPHGPRAAPQRASKAGLTLKLHSATCLSLVPGLLRAAGVHSLLAN